MTISFLRRLGRDLKSDTSGVAMIEFAYSIPLLLTLGGFGMEMSQLALVNTEISQAAMAITDNMSRVGENSNLAATQIREADVIDSFIGAKRQTGSLDIGTRGRIILSSLQQNPDGGQWIKWQRCMGAKNVVGSYGTQNTGATGTSYPGMGPANARITAPDDSAVMHVEIFYDYKPLFTTMFIPARVIRYEAAYIVRDSRDLSQIYNPSPAATVYNCTAYNTGPAVPI
jgi:hypothetical protein